MSGRKAFASSGRKDAFATSVSRGGFGALSSVSALSYLADPPDFSSLDPNAAVSFKNLSLKKDNATKSRALSEIIEYVKKTPFVDGTGDALLFAWTKLYPRASIDNSTHVRELAHTLQHELMPWGRRRSEKQIPYLVGPWLFGTFDRHRPVAKAASEGLSSSLKTPEKLTAFVKKCQPHIIEYAIQAAQETIESLCDDRERAARPDEARAKFLRVMGGVISLEAHIFDMTNEQERSSVSEKHDRFLSLDKIWQMACVEDVVVRRAVFRLLSICLDEKQELISSLKLRLRKFVLCGGLDCDQSGSAVEYLRLLIKLTQKFPNLWLPSAKEPPKKSPLSLLRAFAERGSQGGGVAYWVCLDKLLAIVPFQEFTYDAVTSFAHSLRIGASNRLEPRQTAVEAWACYIDVVQRLSDQVNEAEGANLLCEWLLPLSTAHINQEPSLWITGAQIPVLLRAQNVMTKPRTRDALHTHWKTLADELLTRMTTSLPEQSKDYEKSQNSVAEAGERWFSLVGTMLQKQIDSETIVGPSRKIVLEAAKILERRKFKPFGIASTIESAARKCLVLFRREETEILLELVRRNMECVITSPSAKFMFVSISALSAAPELELRSYYAETWPKLISAILDQKTESRVSESEAIIILISIGEDITQLSRSHRDLQQFIFKMCTQCANGTSTDWKLLEAAFTYSALADESARRVVEVLVDKMNPREDNIYILHALEVIAQHRPELLTTNNALHVNLVTKLLSTTGISGQHATSIRNMLEDTKPSCGKSAVATIVQSNLSTITSHTLDLDTLVDQAVAASNAGKSALETLLPDLNIWMQELHYLFRQVPKPSLSLSNSLGGALFLISAPEQSNNVSQFTQRDHSGAMIPVRMALYVCRLFARGLGWDTLPMERQVDTIYFILLTAQLAADQLTLMGEDGLWKTLSHSEALAQAEEVIDSAQILVDRIISSSDGWTRRSLFDKLVKMMIEESKLLNPANWYAARCLTSLFQAYSSAHGLSSVDEVVLNSLDLIKSTEETALGAVAVFAGFSELLSSNKSVISFCNKMVSEMLGAKPSQAITLLHLVLLNAVSSCFEIGYLPVANNRLVFATREIIAWFADPEELDHKIASEACRALHRLLPCMASIYGSYWEDTLRFCTYLLQRAEGDPVDTRLPYVHAALKLELTLNSMEDPNDDLIDALVYSEKDRSLAILDLLALSRGPESQPQILVEALLCRRVEKIPIKYVQNLSGLYHLIASDSRDIQTAAFGLIHKELPEKQQQIAVDAILNKIDARLPDELLSLLLEPPTLEYYSDDALALFPGAIRSYLLAWHLIFDAFSTAPHKVREDYTTQLKIRNLITPLLDFMYDVLGHSAASAIKLEREGLDSSHILNYDIHVADAEPEEKNMEWLLLHLFFLTLKYVPGLFKIWHINCRSKQTKNAVQSWVEEYYSPLIISMVLNDVIEWAKTQSQDQSRGEDEKELNIKVNKAAREVIAGYEVDDLEASICIKLAQDFPLGGVTVNGIKRVVVAEKKWKSWMIITQGVIMFSVRFEKNLSPLSHFLAGFDSDAFRLLANFGT